MEKDTGGEFDSINPGWSFDEVIFLEMLSEDLDEFLGRQILDCEESLLCFANHCGYFIY